jgi:hypothetical protein
MGAEGFVEARLIVRWGGDESGAWCECSRKVFGRVGWRCIDMRVGWGWGCVELDILGSIILLGRRWGCVSGGCCVEIWSLFRSEKMRKLTKLYITTRTGSLGQDEANRGSHPVPWR